MATAAARERARYADILAESMRAVPPQAQPPRQPPPYQPQMAEAAAEFLSESALGEAFTSMSERFLVGDDEDIDELVRFALFSFTFSPSPPLKLPSFFQLSG